MKSPINKRLGSHEKDDLLIFLVGGEWSGELIQTEGQGQPSSRVMRWAGWVQVRQVRTGWGMILGGGNMGQHPWIRQGSTMAELKRAKEECQESGVGREGRARLPKTLRAHKGLCLLTQGQ